MGMNMRAIAKLTAIVLLLALSIYAGTTTASTTNNYNQTYESSNGSKITLSDLDDIISTYKDTKKAEVQVIGFGDCLRRCNDEYKRCSGSRCSDKFTSCTKSC